MAMQRTGVIQQKGGVGKTAETVGTAGALAARGRRVLVGDLDPQGHATVSALKIPRVPTGEPSLAGALAGDDTGPVRSLIVRHTALDNGGVIDVLPTSLRMFTASRDLDRRPDRERQLGRLLDEVADDYDEFVGDAPPALDILTDSLLATVDGLLVPVQPDDTSIEALQLLFGQIRALERALRRDPATLHGVTPGMFRRPLSLIEQSVMRAYEQMPGVAVLAEFPLAVVVKECWRRGVPVPLDPQGRDSASAEAYHQLADVLDRAAGRILPADRQASQQQEGTRA